MLDWKIVGATIAALVVISSVFVGGFGIREFLSDVIDNINQWLKNSPLGGFFSNPPMPTKEVNFVLYPNNITIKPDSYINLQIDFFNLTQFKGEITIDFENKKSSMKVAGTELVINTELKNTILKKVKLNKFTVNNVKLQLEQNITIDDGSIDISDFIGNTIINIDNIEFVGNVSQLKIKVGDSNWELK